MHTDHIGGVHLFPHASFFVSKQEWKDAHRFGASLIGGYHKSLFNFPQYTYNIIDFSPMKEASVFQEGFDLFGDRSMILVPTPGHTKGHQSLLVYGDQPICIAGDAVLSQNHLREGIVDGVSPHPNLSLQSIRNLQTWSQLHHDAPVVGSHDPEAKIIAAGRT